MPPAGEEGRRASGSWWCCHRGIRGEGDTKAHALPLSGVQERDAKAGDRRRTQRERKEWGAGRESGDGRGRWTTRKSWPP